MKRTVLITGGSSGIGHAMVREFIRAGYLTWFTYHTGKDRADRLIGQLGADRARAFHLELGNSASHRKLMEQLPGPVGVLVNNGGLGTKTVEKVSADVHEQDAALMRVNAVGALWLTRDLLHAMEERGFGKIIFISSVGGGMTQFPGFHLADGMSNAALAYLGKHLQARYATAPIDIFTICPGATETPMFEASTLSGLDEAARKKLIDLLPGRRLIDPSEIAKIAVWLCTDEARVLRGAVLDASLGLGVNPGIFGGGQE
jgi:NAD(P)-dependent dehydrogenase (short-subunit alcohol dehydrogenase family)